MNRNDVMDLGIRRKRLAVSGWFGARAVRRSQEGPTASAGRPNGRSEKRERRVSPAPLGRRLSPCRERPQAQRRVRVSTLSLRAALP